jgi:hypothetical protein
MLVQEKFDRLYFKDVVDAIFSTNDRAIAEEIIEEFSKFWISIPGTRGATGKKTINTSTTYTKLFDEIEPEVVQLDEEDFSKDKLDELEESVK